MNKLFNLKKMIILLLVIAIAAGGVTYYQYYHDHAAQQEKEAKKPQNYTVPPSEDHHVGQGPKIATADSDLPPVNATNNVLYAMRDMGYKLETGINYVDYHHEYQKLYSMIESYKSEYPNAKKINTEFQKVNNNMIDLDMKWNLDLYNDPTYVFEEYTPNSGIWPDLIKKHPAVANAEKNGNGYICIDDVRTVLINDLHKQMQSSSHNVVTLYQ